MLEYRLNYNIDTDEAETEIPELYGIQEITTADEILELLGPVIILNNYQGDGFIYLIKKVRLLWKSLSIMSTAGLVVLINSIRLKCF